MTTPQLSIRSMLLICGYVSVCSLVYVYPSMWIGTMVVAATIVWLALASVDAFRSRSSFSLVFSLCAWTWLVFWLGFHGDNSKTVSPDWLLPEIVHRAMTPFHDLPVVNRSLWRDEQGNLVHPERYGTAYNIYFGHKLMKWPGEPLNPPAFRNTIRLAACISALLFGFLGGWLNHWITANKPTRSRRGKADYASSMELVAR